MLAFMHMLPSGASQLPGGRHEGVAVKTRVPTLGSPRRPVASAPAPGAVRAWTRFLGHGPSKMFIFARFYKVFCPDLGQDKMLIFQWFFMVFANACPNRIINPGEYRGLLLFMFRYSILIFEIQ